MDFALKPVAIVGIAPECAVRARRRQPSFRPTRRGCARTARAASSGSSAAVRT